MTARFEGDELVLLSLAIDEAMDAGDGDKLRALLVDAARLHDHGADSLARASAAFCRANAHAALRKLSVEVNPDVAWEWDAPNSKQEIYWLRVALDHVAQANPKPGQTDLRLRIETNLGNALNGVGRFCESLEYWDAVIAKLPSYAMAQANRGYGLTWYARSLYDPGHQNVFLWDARRSLARGLAAGVESHAAIAIGECLAYVESLGDWDQFVFDQDGYPLGETPEEREYRSWCLRGRLFLNPLNDLGSYPIAARDVVTFPSIVQSLDAGPQIPEVYGIYNQLTQEYVSARYLCFEAVRESELRLHYSDKDVLLYDTLDYRVLRLWVEKLKMAFLSAFSVFDKIAFLVNHFWSLKIPHDKVNFGSLWFVNRELKRGLLTQFNGAENWPLRGLFSLSRDLHWKAEGEFVAEPQAKLLHAIRNHIAHKYLAVHDGVCWDIGMARESLPATELSYRISDSDFIAATLKLLKLVRSALIYVSLAARRHEEMCHPKDGNLYSEMPLCSMGDDRP